MVATHNTHKYTNAYTYVDVTDDIDSNYIILHINLAYELNTLCMFYTP